MINKDNNLNIDILRQQNANIPLQEASSQSEEPHQLGNSKSEGNLHNSASKDNNIGAMLKKDVEKLSTLVLSLIHIFTCSDLACLGYRATARL